MVEVGVGKRFPSSSPTNLTKLDFCLLFIFQNHDFRCGFKISPLLTTHSQHSGPCLSRVLNETGDVNITMKMMMIVIIIINCPCLQLQFTYFQQEQPQYK